jgi:PA14 domain/FecR protein
VNDALFEDYLADRLSAADVVRIKQLLASDREARARFVEVLLEWESLSETARQLTTNSCPMVDINSSNREPSKRHRPSLRVAPTRPRTRHLLNVLVPMGALAATFMVALLVVRPVSEPQLLGNLSAATAGVTIKRGSIILVAKVGSAVLPGDHVRVGDGAYARLEYTDHTVLSFDQRTDAQILADGSPAVRVGKRVSLVWGRVTAEVVKQPLGRPMIFTTPNAQATVIGTVLSLGYAPTSSVTLLEVAEGKVGIVGISDASGVASHASPVEISSGNFAMVNGSSEIIARSMSKPVEVVAVIPSAVIPSAAVSSPAVKPAKSDEKTYRAGVRATYYTGNNLNDPIFSRIESGIHVDLGLDNQPPDQRLSDFVVIWSGYLQPLYSEKYLLTIRSDSSARVFIDNKLVIDSWGTNQISDHQGTLTLEAGKRYPLRVEYKQPNSGMLIKLDWVSKSQSPETIPAACLSTDP